MIDIEIHRARARAGAGLKIAAGIGFLGVFGGSLALWGAQMPGMIVVCIVAAGLAQAGFLAYRAVRQLRVARGQLRPALVVAVREHSTGTAGERAMTCVLRLDVELPEGGEVEATSTNVFGVERGRQLVGQRIEVLWSDQYPGDAYAVEPQSPPSE